MMDKVDIVNKDIITSDSIQFKGITLDNDSNCSTGDKVDLRFYNIKNKSFHPKSYIFEYEEDGDVLFLNHSIIIDDAELRRYSSVWKRPKIFNALEKVEDNIEDYGHIIG